MQKSQIAQIAATYLQNIMLDDSTIILSLFHL